MILHCLGSGSQLIHKRSRLSSSSSSDEECLACIDDSSREVCNISVSDLQEIHNLEGVYRYGMKCNDLRYTIFVERGAATSVKTNIERNFPKHNFIFEPSDAKRGHIELAGIHKVGSASIGTLGGLIDVTSATSPNMRTYALTCRHVIPISKIDEDVYICNSVPGSDEVVMKPIGKLRTYVDAEGRLGHGERPRKRRQTFDIAMIEIDPHSSIRSQYRKCTMVPHNTLHCMTGDIKVQKTGCKTGCTFGIIKLKSCSVDFDYIDSYGKEKTVSLHNDIEIAKDLDKNVQGYFADSGDSGAIIVAENGGPHNHVAIGMFTFYNNEDSDNNNESRAYAFPIYDALEHQFSREPGILGENVKDLYAYVGL
ncbi:unnamed protein product [Owenia fusiformis]|uniref:Peptidase S1 domain-containing protein n=1 Tax=Owenia fusiformis TaxID=6347 RepID=A0A8S4QD33_OWEFU|nr:unnamed protein product [Owenia fusiformis]